MTVTDLLPPVAPAAAGAVVVAALAMVLTPGPNMLYLASRSIGHGRRAGLVSLAGTGLGFLVHLLVANLGLAVVFVVVPWLFIGLKAVGVLYLAHLAWQALRPGGRGAFEIRDVPRDSDARLFQMGLVTNVLNPKVAIMYLSLIPQFVDPTRGHEVAQGITLGLIQIAVSLAVNTLVVLTASSLATALASRPRWLAWQRCTTGMLLAGVAVLLARDVPAQATT